MVASEVEKPPASPTSTPTEPLYAVPTVAMLRCPAVGAGSQQRPAADPKSLHEAVFQALARDETLLRAVAIASPTLAQTVDRWHAGEQLSDKQRRRAAVSLATYQKRMRHRSTPFGVFAGVAAATFSDSPSVVLGDEHVASLRPSGDWMASVVDQLEREPAIARERRLSLNNTCFFRGNWLINPYHVPDTNRPLQAGEVGVRKTPLLAGLYEYCEQPRSHPEVICWLKNAKPGVAEERLMAYLRELLDKNFLISDLRITPAEPDRIGYVLKKLDSNGSDLVKALGTVRARIGSIANEQLSRKALGEISGQMLRIAGASKSPLQVDLRVDARVQFPRQVAEEAAKAAHLLAMLTPQEIANQTLRAYENSFRERFGPEAHVPLLDLIDPVLGLGLPAGGLPKISGDKSVGPVGSGSDEAKATLLSRALGDRARQVDLAAEDIEAMALDWKDGAERRLPSFDLFATVLTESWSCLVEGKFDLLLSPHVSHQGGSALGRFEYLDSQLRDVLRALEAPRSQGGANEREVHLIFQPLAPSQLNMLTVRPWLEHSIRVGVPDGDDGALRLQALEAGVDDRGMYLWSRELGEKVVPVVHHMFNTATGAPRLVHFLRAIGRRRRRIVWGWNWGQVAEAQPFLPGVRHGRVVLALPEWRVPQRLVAARQDERTWRDNLEAWREDMKLPRFASLVFDDLELRLDLDDALDVEIFRHNVSLRSRVVEAPSLRQLHGALGDRPHEIVVPVRPLKQPETWPAAHRAVATPVRFPPGSEWLFARLEADTPRHTEVLREHLPGLLAELRPHIQSWFFVRYLDPTPHLRLRFRGSPSLLACEVLPRLGDFAAGLHAVRVARDLTIGTYEPEVDRYGGAGAIAYAESVFWQDSELVLRSLAVEKDDDLLSRHVRVAAQLCVMAEAFLGPDWRQQVVGGLPNRPQAAAFQRCRPQLRQLTSLESVEAGVPWPAFRDALHAFDRRLRHMGTGEDRRRSVLMSLWHMHFNRRIGVDRTAEELVLDLVRRAALDVIGRRTRS